MAAYIGVYLVTTQTGQCHQVRSSKDCSLYPTSGEKQSSDQRKVENYVWEPQLLLTAWQTSLAPGCRSLFPHPGVSPNSSTKWFVKLSLPPSPDLLHTQVYKDETHISPCCTWKPIYTHSCLFASRLICEHMYLRVGLHVTLEPLLREHSFHKLRFTQGMSSPSGKPDQHGCSWEQLTWLCVGLGNCALSIGVGF